MFGSLLPALNSPGAHTCPVIAILAPGAQSQPSFHLSFPIAALPFVDCLSLFFISLFVRLGFYYYFFLILSALAENQLGQSDLCLVLANGLELLQAAGCAAFHLWVVVDKRDIFSL